MRSAYLDNNATTRPAREVVDAVRNALEEHWANPSSVHRLGQAARRQIELAREEVARLIGATGREIVFTSGGTEANNLAIRGTLEQSSERRVLITDRVEHSATRQTAEILQSRGIDVLWMELTPDGLIDCDWLLDTLKGQAGGVALVTTQWANNETGAIQPVEVIGDLCREYGVRYHCDATQWVGKMPVDVAIAPVDLMTFSAHKFHGPKGVGSLYVRQGVRLSPMTTGGPQERERRGGTENTPGIIGMGVACTLAGDWLARGGDQRPWTKAEALRDQLEDAIRAVIPDARVNQGNVDRIWNTANIAFPHLEAEAILLLLSERGVFASAGAACSSGSLDPSPVLLAMGIRPELAHGSIRLSLSRETTESEITYAVGVIEASITRLRKSMPNRA